MPVGAQANSGDDVPGTPGADAGDAESSEPATPKVTCCTACWVLRRLLGRFWRFVHVFVRSVICSAHAEIALCPACALQPCPASHRLIVPFLIPPPRYPQGITLEEHRRQVQLAATSKNNSHYRRPTVAISHLLAVGGAASRCAGRVGPRPPPPGDLPPPPGIGRAPACANCQSHA
jgi:hypothetical protein